ncbi:MAG: hypothetical protein ABMA64_32010 [Myxococcota bacterium]
MAGWERTRWAFRATPTGRALVAAALVGIHLLVAPRLVPSLAHLPLLGWLRPHVTNLHLCFVVVLVGGIASALEAGRLRGAWAAVAFVFAANLGFEFLLPDGDNLLADGNTRDPWDAVAGLAGVAAALAVSWAYLRWGIEPVDGRAGVES